MEQEKISIAKEVMDQTVATLGSLPVEQLALIGSTNGGTFINRFYFDFTAKITSISCSPDTEACNMRLENWNRQGVSFTGIFHSHPASTPRPTAADIEYAIRIIEARNMHSLVLGIVLPKAGDKPAKLRLYRVSRDGSVSSLSYEVADSYMTSSRGVEYRLCDRLGKNRFQRIGSLYPLKRLSEKLVIGIGVGGAMQFYEELARSGVGNFLLIDPDRVSAENIATQQAYISDIGLFKVDAVSHRIQDINPEAHVTAIPRPLDDSFTDEEFEQIIGENLFKRHKDILVCGCTDSFLAQARSATLVMKYGTCYLAAQMYAGGEAAEIYFSYPGVTNNSCPRCSLASRYETYADGYQNVVSSEAAPIFATTRLNSLKGQIALMLLLYHEDEDCRYSNMLDLVAESNFVQINMSPYASEHLDIHIFDTDMVPELSFFDEAVWYPQMPANKANGFKTCPLCGGTGDLLSLMGSITDTREAII